VALLVRAKQLFVAATFTTTTNPQRRGRARRLWQANDKAVGWTKRDGRRAMAVHELHQTGDWDEMLCEMMKAKEQAETAAVFRVLREKVREQRPSRRLLQRLTLRFDDDRAVVGSCCEFTTASSRLFKGSRFAFASSRRASKWSIRSAIACSRASNGSPSAN
jgi:hypothetical protein